MTKPLPVAFTFRRLITTEYRMGKIVTPATKISAGAAKIQPILASFLRLTSGRPAGGATAVTAGCSAALEIVVMGQSFGCAGWKALGSGQSGQRHWRAAGRIRSPGLQPASGAGGERAGGLVLSR